MENIEIIKGEDYWIIYCGPLEISDFGKTFDEAKNNFKEAIDTLIQNKLMERENEK